MEEIASKCKEQSQTARYHGLINQGATCYLNSVLQVLFMTKEFREAVKGTSSENCKNKFIDPLLKKLFEDLESSTSKTTGITNKLEIKVNEQRDAAEYFEKILRQTSPEASQIFQGELTHKNTCTNCKIDTNTSDPFWNLPLSLESDNKDYNVEKGIKDLFRKLHIGGENQMYCEGCDAKTDAEIVMEMTRHPDVLTLLLKRFKFDYRKQQYVKIKRTVTVPHTLQIPKNQTYELYAFVEHFGDLSSGHYIVTIKSHEDDEWYKFSDSSVTLLHQQLVNNGKSSSAYLLFYRKLKNHAAETGKTNEGEDTDCNQVDKQENCEKKITENRKDKDGEAGLGKQGRKKKKNPTKGNNKDELQDDKSEAQITQKRKADIQDSEHGFADKSKGSRCPKQTKQSSHNYHKNNANNEDEILDLKGGENRCVEKTEQSCVPPDLSVSKGLMENQRRDTGSEQMKPCDSTKQEVIHSENKSCSVEDMTRGISSETEPQTSTFKTKTQKTAGEVNGENFKPETGKVPALSNKSQNVSPSQEPQKNDTGRIGNSQKKKCSSKKNAKKSERTQQGACDKSENIKTKRRHGGKNCCLFCVSNTHQSSDSESYSKTFY